MPSPTLDLSIALMSCPSVTPDDAGCQSILRRHLERLSFTCESLPAGPVDNLWATLGSGRPLFVFAGHTDVVPTGPLPDWDTPPFSPTIRDGYLYGRGACDMKTGIAAQVCAVERFVATNPRFPGTIAFLITSDEEAEAIHGTSHVMALLKERGIQIDYCVIGEPSSATTVGDQIRIGRRGSLHGHLTIRGKQGHVAFPHLACNPIHQSAVALDALAREVWDNGNTHFPPTTFQITNLHAGTGALNVIPGHLELDFNFRFGTASTIESLKARVATLLQAHHLTYDLIWQVGALPFLTQTGKLITTTQTAIKTVTGRDTTLSTGGGTSDGRFIAPTGAEVVELGVPNTSAHQVNESVKVADVEILTNIYNHLLQSLMFS